MKLEETHDTEKIGESSLTFIYFPVCQISIVGMGKSSHLSQKTLPPPTKILYPVIFHPPEVLLLRYLEVLSISCLLMSLYSLYHSSR